MKFFIEEAAVIIMGMGLALFCIWPVPADAGNIRTLPLNTTAGTEAKEVIAKAERFDGRSCIHVTVSPDHKESEEGGCDNCTFLLADRTPFKNGVIEISVAGKPSEGAPAWARGFVGVVFRVSENMSEYEGFYLRPMNALEQGPRRNHTFQYFSYPDYPWNRLRKEFPGKYEGYADIKPGEWTDLRIEVNGSAARFFVNDEQVLSVDGMFHGADTAGGVGLFTEPATDAYFSNLKITYAEEIRTPKQTVTEFFDLAFVQGKLAEAARKYVSSETYIQHNPNAPDGREPLIKGLAPFLSKIKYKAEIKRIIAEDDLVVVHSHGTYESDDPNFRGEASVDIFRVENGKIVEHWDVIQPVPQKSKNSNTMF